MNSELPRQTQLYRQEISAGTTFKNLHQQKFPGGISPGYVLCLEETLLTAMPNMHGNPLL